MADRYFTPAEVARLIPALTRLMGDVMTAAKEANAARERLEAERRRITLAGGGVLDRRAWRADTELGRRCGRRARAGLEKIVKLGGAPKDLDLGLVDFPCLREGREVNLCWKHGETEIRYWHALDEGYAARKPL